MSKNKILLDIFFNVKHIPEQHIEAPIINFCSLIERLEVSLFFNSIDISQSAGWSILFISPM